MIARVYIRVDGGGCTNEWIDKASYISVPVLLNLLNELEEKIRWEAFLSILSFSRTSFINSIKQKHKCKILFIK